MDGGNNQPGGTGVRYLADGANATITEIIEWLEVNLQVKIGLAYRRWFSISKRKRVSQTKYIDQLKEAIEKRLDDENGI